MTSGQAITTHDLIAKRPLAGGICASKLPDIVGRTLSVDVLQDQPLMMEHLQDD